MLQICWNCQSLKNSKGPFKINSFHHFNYLNGILGILVFHSVCLYFHVHKGELFILGNGFLIGAISMSLHIFRCVRRNFLVKINSFSSWSNFIPHKSSQVSLLEMKNGYEITVTELQLLAYISTGSSRLVGWVSFRPLINI